MFTMINDQLEIICLHFNSQTFYNDRERVAAELIVTELQYQRHSVELPTTAPMKLKSLTIANQSYAIDNTNKPLIIHTQLYSPQVSLLQMLKFKGLQ